MELISRPDGLHHLLLSDVNNLMQSIAHDFPDIAKTYSIGKSYEGRDINVIEMTLPSTMAKKEATLVQFSDDLDDDSSSKSLSQKDNKVKQNVDKDGFVKDGKPAILMTGATHARELISTNLNVFQMLKLLRLGAIEKDPKWEKLFQQNKYIFMPIFNVDGVNYIEEGWVKDKKILPKRKNMHGVHCS